MYNSETVKIQHWFSLNNDSSKLNKNWKDSIIVRSDAKLWKLEGI